MSAAPIIVWFRQDLRLHDHTALSAAAATGAPLIPVYVHDEETKGCGVRGGASKWWLHESLKSLDEDLRKLGSSLVFARGPALEVLSDLARETGAGAIFWSRGYEPWAMKLERKLHGNLEGAGVRCRRFSGSLLFEPEDIKTNSGESFRAFKPFHKACIDEAASGPCLNAPAALSRVPDGVESDKLDSWKLQPRKPDWASSISAAWSPGEAGARARLATLEQAILKNYETGLERPALDGTSRLSPHLQFGEISPREVWNAVTGVAVAKKGKLETGALSFLHEFLWREFSHHHLFHWPNVQKAPHGTEFAKFPWRNDADDLKAWQQGRTGYPIIDAGMRELYATGWIHSRMRTIVASFLVKHLLISWQHGAAWFANTLVDADIASNAVNWQHVTGCGMDAPSFSRILNPVLQGKKIDPEGTYVKSWVPEFSKLPKERIHEPWKASKADMTKARVSLGETYPARIIDLGECRVRALEAFEMTKAKP